MDLCFTPATELRQLIRSRALSPVELMTAVVERAEALDALNALTLKTYEQALDQARLAENTVSDAPLHGLPITIKDLFFTKGQKTMSGSHRFADRVSTFDAPVVERLAASGGISIGKTVVPELGWKGCGDSPLTGISHNPWKRGMNAGGSSTGAGICAAAGIGPLHQGSDGAGSIRIPSAFCGVYGLKPSFGRVPYYPMSDNGNISCLGPITRTVGDAALMLEAMAGPDDRDQMSLPGEPEPYLARLDDGIAGRKIAFSLDFGYLKVDPEVADLVRSAVKAFEDLGCIVEEIPQPWPDPSEAELCLWSSRYASTLLPLVDEWEDRMDPGLVACARQGGTYSAGDYVAAVRTRNDLYEHVRTLFSRYDLLLSPSLSVAAFPAGTLIPSHWEQHAWDWIRWAGHLYPFNLTWLPAASCPCGFTAEGLPVGLQIVAGRHRDLLALQASRAFEQARPWADHRPPL